MTTLAQIKSAAKTAFYDIDSEDVLKSLTRLVNAYCKEKENWGRERIFAVVGLEIEDAILEVASDRNPNPSSLRNFLIEEFKINEQDLDTLIQEPDLDDNHGKHLAHLISYGNFDNLRDLMAFEVKNIQVEEREENRTHYKLRA